MIISDRAFIVGSKVLNVICAIALIGMAIYRFISEGSEIKIMDAMWTFYWILFGVFIILAEFKWNFFLKYFNFLSGYCGKGLFISFCGSLLIESWSFRTVIGIILIVNGFFCMILGIKFKGSEETNPNEKKLNESNDIKISERE